MNKAGKSLEKDEKKRVKEDIALLRKRLMKAKPEKMTEGDVSELKRAMQQLEQSSRNVCERAQQDGGQDGQC